MLRTHFKALIQILQLGLHWQAVPNTNPFSVNTKDLPHTPQETTLGLIGAPQIKTNTNQTAPLTSH